MKTSIDPKTGLKHRSVDIQSIMQLDRISGLRNAKGKNLFTRYKEGLQFLEQQKKLQLWLYNRVILTGPSTQVLAMDDNNNIFYGVNFASADYLGLAKNQFARDAAIQAATNFGVNSAGSPLAFGATKYYMQLKNQLAQFWGVKSVLIYSAGWLAGYGIIKGMIRQNDHIIMDQLAHNCLQEGSMAATKNIHKFHHLNEQEMHKKLKQVRQKNPDSGILIVTQGLFSMDSDSPDLNSYQKICKQYQAFLLIDCAHDFGHLGETGKGMFEVQKLQDKSNVLLVGTGSKCLSTNIGFVGCDDVDILQGMKYVSTTYMFTNAINPVQAATSLANLRILRSQLGSQLRKKILQNYHYLRGQLEKNGRKVLGRQCAILPVFVGNQIVCRLISRIMMDNGVHVNGIQFPVVKIGQARLRVSIMPQHTKQHLDTFVRVFELAHKQGTEIFERQMQVYADQMQKRQQAKL